METEQPPGRDVSKVEDRTRRLQALARDAENGSTQAIADLCGECREIAFRYLVRQKHTSPCIASDVAQETAVIIFTKTLRSEDFCVSFVTTIAGRVLIDQWRKTRRETAMDSLQVPVTEHTSVDRLPDVDVARCLDSLQQEYRMVIELKYWGGYKANDAAELLGITVTTLRARIHEAKQRMANCLGRARVTGSQGRYRTSAGLENKS